MLVFNKYFCKNKKVKVVLWRHCCYHKRLYLPNQREYKLKRLEFKWNRPPQCSMKLRIESLRPTLCWCTAEETFPRREKESEGQRACLIIVEAPPLLSTTPFFSFVFCGHVAI
jgi:hypothetical protein